MKYTVYKLGRKQETENKAPSQVYDGKQFSEGTIGVMKLNDFETEFLTGEVEKLEKLEDLVGHSAYFLGPHMYDYVRTSIVRHVYKHGDSPEMNLPDGFPESDLERLEYPELKEGDILVATMNSIYLAQAE